MKAKDTLHLAALTCREVGLAGMGPELDRIAKIVAVAEAIYDHNDVLPVAASRSSTVMVQWAETSIRLDVELMQAVKEMRCYGEAITKEDVHG